MSKKLPNIHTDFAEWYQEVVYSAQMADLSPVRGSMVIRPYGYALWENIKSILDKKIKDTGHENAMFPLLIPMSFLQKEAEHVKGFAPELAIVTHAGGKELEEPLVIRPTSETIIHYMFAQWMRSWRDLPFKINQWCNVVRWEMRTRPFLRTSEFLWQEGHTAHETEQEADEEAELMLAQYLDVIHTYLAIPGIPGIKSDSERFAGALKTMTIEVLMQDGKALQMCTSHRISQSFAKAFNMTFQDRDGKIAHPHLTSWGSTTRLIGAVIMVHGDEKGLILPPKVAPYQVVIVPIYKTGNDTQPINEAIKKLKNELTAAGVRVHVDDRTFETPGSKFYEWELKGVPVRIDIGPRDVAAGHGMVTDRLGLKKEAVPFHALPAYLAKHLDDIQQTMFMRAKERQQAMWYKHAKLADFIENLDNKGGFYQTGWCGNADCETKLKEHKATIRCLLPENGFQQCFNCDGKSISDILIARAY